MTSIAIVGAGLAGSGTAWRLAQAGHDVTVLERFAPANAFGSSHGSARIFRYAYPEQEYVHLVTLARQGWTELESAAGETLIDLVGSVDFGPLRAQSGLAGLLAAEGVEHEVLGSAVARERWGQIAFDTDVLWTPGAGVIDAERAVMAMLTLAQRLGADVRTDFPVVRVERAGAGYRVIGADGTAVEAEQVVVAAGGWLPDLLGDLGLPDAFLSSLPSLRVTQENAFHFPYRDPSATWPTMIRKAPQIQTYALPGGRDAGFTGLKIAEYNGGKPILSATHQDRTIDPVNRERVIDFVTEFLPGLVPEPYAEATCLFTSTPDEDFIIDRVEGITVLSPCSGHGAKFAPLIGEFAAALVAGSADAVPTRFRTGMGAELVA
ncbi:FAD-dependent oxidoreductase [Raineyella fluvialis]|uniref:FAD-dependent oxidoreductase n=1 Tax=Raineyella fluvialis TaxID=2662261 RepID=A0A5Q2FE33_9ACTN|nr:FAD-dependent oxidoreductase [Raineyella fluvialis]QGF24057.1 FAD-dependent oxidoreductase [Raineyella fluvialis]